MDHLDNIDVKSLVQKSLSDANSKYEQLMSQNHSIQNVAQEETKEINAEIKVAENAGDRQLEKVQGDQPDITMDKVDNAQLAIDLDQEVVP